MYIALGQGQTAPWGQIIIIIISIFQEDNEFSSLPFGPPINTGIDYYQAFFFFLVSCAMLVMHGL